jgi:hypothetical protein
LAQSARNTPNLVVLALWLATGLLVGHLSVVLAGSLFYLFLVGRNATSPRFWRKLLEAEAAEARELPAETSLNDPALQLQVRSLRKGYEEIERVLKHTPEPVRAHLAPALASLEDLRARASQLLRDADELSRFLVGAPREGATREIQRLTDVVARTAEPEVLHEYEGALAVRKEQLAAVTRVEVEHERMLASLHFIVGTIEAIPASIYRLRVLEFRAKDDRVRETREELTRMSGELAASQHLLEGLARSPGRLVGDEDEASEWA